MNKTNVVPTAWKLSVLQKRGHKNSIILFQLYQRLQREVKEKNVLTREALGLNDAGKTNNTIYPFLVTCRASLVAQLVKNAPAELKTPVQFLGQEDHLEKG